MSTIKTGLVLSCLLGIFFFSACKDSKSKETKSEKTDSSAVTESKPKDSSLIVKAKFESFTLGDASHFTFTDETGKSWDFAEVEDSTTKFAVELPEKEANETNQGWSSNKDQVGKWFNLTYINRMQPQYQDGPVANVMVVTKVQPVQ